MSAFRFLDNHFIPALTSESYKCIVYDIEVIIHNETWTITSSLTRMLVPHHLTVKTFSRLLKNKQVCHIYALQKRIRHLTTTCISFYSKYEK